MKQMVFKTIFVLAMALMSLLHLFFPFFELV